MDKEYTVTRWGVVDDTSDPQAFIEYLDRVGSLETIKRLKARSYELLNPREGHQLLDIGCGLGDDVRTLARHVGLTGRVVGIDASAVMIAEARRRSDGLTLPIEFVIGDIQKTGLPDDSFDGCRAERVFVHLEEPRSTLSEMIRVAKPGAQLVVLDADWETLIIDSSNRAVTRKLIHFFCDTGKSRWIGRQLRRLFVATGLKHTGISADVLTITDLKLADEIFKLREMAEQAQAAGAVTANEGKAWIEELRRANKSEKFFAALTMFCVSGTK
jgi:ubiquinone/menaquinone biosynthesis C-methylase UbiE